MRRIALVLFAALVPAGVAWSAGSMQDLADYRHNQFEAAGKHMKLSSMILKGQVDRPADLVGHAEALHALSKAIPTMFPEGSGPDAVKTDALATVWEKNAEFLEVAATFEKETKALIAAAKKADKDMGAYKAQFGKVGKQCGTCHDTFRKDEK